VAQFDVHHLGKGLVVDCQSDLLDPIDTCFVLPLTPRTHVQQVAQRLNPIFEIDGREYLLLTQAAAAVRRAELGAVIASLADRSFEITAALDVLIGGV
jgi:toxin CcdB